MTKENPKFIRECQECGNKQEMKHPNTYKDESWRELKCRNCKSPALSYGSYESSLLMIGKHK